MSDSVRPHRRQPTRFPRPWDSPGKNTGVGCHFLLQCMKVKSESEVTQSCPTLRASMDCSLPGSSVQGIFQARVLQWGATAFSTDLDYLLSKLPAGDDRGWDGWMASPTWWTWVRASSRRWWWTGKPDVLQPIGSQGVGHNWVTELNFQLDLLFTDFLDWIHCFLDPMYSFLLYSVVFAGGYSPKSF